MPVQYSRLLSSPDNLPTPQHVQKASFTCRQMPIHSLKFFVGAIAPVSSGAMEENMLNIKNLK